MTAWLTTIGIIAIVGGYWLLIILVFRAQGGFVARPRTFAEQLAVLTARTRDLQNTIAAAFMPALRTVMLQMQAAYERFADTIIVRLDLEDRDVYVSWRDAVTIANDKLLYGTAYVMPHKPDRLAAGRPTHHRVDPRDMKVVYVAGGPYTVVLDSDATRPDAQ